MNQKEILILGTGALATLFAARLSAAGILVTMLGSWREGLAALNRNGAGLDGFGSFRVRATSDTATCRGARIALVLVKTWQTESAADRLKDCLEEDGIVLTLQNGLGSDVTLARRLGEPRVGRGVTTLGASLVSPGLVRLAGDGPVILEMNPRLDPLRDMLAAAGFELEASDDVPSLVWSKLVVSSAINPLSALLQVRNGVLLEIPSSRNLMAALAVETAAVAKAQGVELGFQDPDQAVEEVAERTGDNLSSMLQDIRRGAPTEIEAINGEVVRLAHECGIPVPVNEVILQLIRALSVRGKI